MAEGKPEGKVAHGLFALLLRFVVPRVVAGRDARRRDDVVGSRTPWFRPGRPADAAS